ncbi:hypothetical protein LX36DRAFT_124543 [Colletotrichum falcatum]|nr:hypothetical protein LX36DRAFT_124543 [Colletotrichum falcatum]
MPSLMVEGGCLPLASPPPLSLSLSLSLLVWLLPDTHTHTHTQPSPTMESARGFDDGHELQNTRITTLFPTRGRRGTAHNGRGAASALNKLSLGLLKGLGAEAVGQKKTLLTDSCRVTKSSQDVAHLNIFGLSGSEKGRKG